MPEISDMNRILVKVLYAESVILPLQVFKHICFTEECIESHAVLNNKAHLHASELR